LSGNSRCRALSSTRMSSTSSSSSTADHGNQNQAAQNQKLLLLSNQQLVEQRLAALRAKKEARYQSMQKATHRNWKIKSMLYDDDNDNNRGQQEQQQSNNNNKSKQEELLYAVRVSVCEELRQELKLSGREKRGRVFIQKNSSSSSLHSLEALKLELQSFFRALRKGSFTLSASFPQLAPNGTPISSSSSNSSHATIDNDESFWPIETDDDVIKTFQAADEFYEENEIVMKRPAIVIHVQQDPNASAASHLTPLPSYLQNLSNPADSPTITMLSFYAFPPPSVGIHNPEDFAEMLRKLWGKRHFHALGRVYVAHEGVNAQMAVPTNVLQNFIECCNAIPELGEYIENGINVDPKPLTRDEFATAGTAAARDGKAAPPFTNLHIRVRTKIVADGLNHALDWQSAGYDMPPLEWHAALLLAKQARQRQQQQQASKQQQGDESNTALAGEQTDKSNQDDCINSNTLPLIFDCRNGYETSVGRFEGAEPLETENFRETWGVLRNRLKGVPKDAPIMTYCTGGIRCVKVGAYLTQEMGFTNVSRLAGGIIAYDRTLNEKAPNEEPLFKGTNFVFDGRLGRSITEDAMGECITCGSTTSLVSNCLNENCHKRMIQCENCRTSFHGTCSNACRHRLVNGAKIILTPCIFQ
jgi:predicted sulfurtransferase